MPHLFALTELKSCEGCRNMAWRPRGIQIAKSETGITLEVTHMPKIVYGLLLSALFQVIAPTARGQSAAAPDAAASAAAVAAPADSTEQMRQEIEKLKKALAAVEQRLAAQEKQNQEKQNQAQAAPVKEQPAAV